MGRIHVLGENISNKIAAGEVIERPASVVKELVENSIDASSTSITVEINNGGISYIRVTDNGSGMADDDAKVAFIRHATSKITTESDLSIIKTLGFRGEALASIASVSQVEMHTKPKDDTFGTRAVYDGGECQAIESAGCPDGTTIIVKNLFYNTPARLKFLKKDSREGAAISEIMYDLALSRPDISFKYISNGKLVFNTPGDGNLKNTVLVLYGKDIYNSLIKVSYKGNILSISGFIGSPDSARSNRNYQMFFINNRYIKSRMLSAAVDNAYKTYLMVNKFAFCILFISIYPDLVDVNVHPTKAEVRFQDEKEVFSAVFNTVRNGLAGEVLIPKNSMEVKKAVVEQMKVEDVPDYSRCEAIKEEHFDNNGINKINIPQNIDNIEKVYTPVEDVSIGSDDALTDDGAHSLMPPLVIIGQCHLTYILCQGPDGLYIIDQHAAHERILYEKFRNSFEKGGVASQKLLSPLVVELVPKEINIIKDKLKTLEKLGFEIELFGSNAVMLRSVPILFGEPILKKFFIETVDLMDENASSSKSSVDRILYTMACRSAVKANDKLDITEMEELVRELRKTQNPYNCPHGRPTIIRITRLELEKKFKRIQ